MSDTNYGRCDTCGQQWPCPAHVGAEAGMEIAFSGFRQGYAAALRAVLDKVEARIEQIQAAAAREEACDRRRWAAKHATQLDLLASLHRELRGYPNRGISCEWVLEYYVAPGHAAKIYGMPATGPVRYEVACSCGMRPWLGWSVHVIGAKRIARRHVENLEKDTWMIGGFDR